MAQDKEKNRVLLDKWNFSWPILGVLIGGRSTIDLPDIHVANYEDAGRFVKSYGYDPDKIHDARMIHATIIEALIFIERNLMPKEWKQGMIPPASVSSCDDVRELLVWACDRTPEHSLRRMWSCAVLRVMHTIAHIEGAFRYSHIDAARDEIMARFQSALSYQSDSIWMMQGEHRVPLVKFDWKIQKSRESILLKLLHKRANVAETIYDMIGIRIVVQNQADAIQVVRMLYKAHVISFPNTIPARSRNTMINLDSFRVQLDDLRGNLMTEVTSPESLEAALKTLEIPPPVDDKDNLHSGSEYHAIQLTCRQLIRTPRPLTVLRKNLEVAATEAQIKSEINTYFTEMAAVLKNIARLIGDEEFAFFPFEVQIMDKKAWETNSTGKASHGRYKRSQVRAARRRVLNEILPLS